MTYVDDQTAKQTPSETHSEDDFRSPFRGKRFEEFNEHVHEALHGSNVSRVNLWNTERTLLFSTNRQAIGSRAPKDTLWSTLYNEKTATF